MVLLALADCFFCGQAAIRNRCSKNGRSMLENLEATAGFAVLQAHRDLVADRLRNLQAFCSANVDEALPSELPTQDEELRRRTFAVSGKLEAADLKLYQKRLSSHVQLLSNATARLVESHREECNVPEGETEDQPEEADENEKAPEAVADGGNNSGCPPFFQHLQRFPLLKELGPMLNETTSGGAICLDPPSNPGKDTTCAYLLDDLEMPDLDFRRDEVTWLDS